MAEAVQSCSNDELIAAFKEFSAESRDKISSALGTLQRPKACDLLKSLAEGLPRSRDLTSGAENDKVLEVATALVDQDPESMLGPVAERCAEYPAIALEALYCAASKARLRKIEAAEGVHLTVLFAMYGETARIKPKSQESPHGEDFLRQKVKQVAWLFDGAPANFSWDIVAVDDGCPDQPSSTDVAKAIIEQEGWSNVRVIKLQDGIDKASPVANMGSTKDSRKGGSILYGLFEEATAGRGAKEHIIMYTDSDLSANCAMSGLLCANIVTDGHPISCGHRYGEPGALLIKDEGATKEPEATGGKPDKMIILFRHWVRGQVIPCVSMVKDTQCGFKAFRARGLPQILPDVANKQASFDVELLIRACSQLEKGSKGIGVVPIVFTEDFAASTMASSKQVGGKLEPGPAHLKMVTDIVDIRNTIAGSMAGAEALVTSDEALLAFLGGLELEHYKALISRLTEQDAALPAEQRDAMFDRAYTLGALQELAGTGAA